MSSIRLLQSPKTILVGLDARKEVIPALRERKLSRPLIVTDRVLAKLPVLQDYALLLREAGS